MSRLRHFILFITIAVSFASRAQVNLSSGLAAYYPFNGNALDASGNNNNGTLSGSAAIVTDQWSNPSSACNMSGPNNAGRVTIPNSATLQFSTTASFSAWFRLNSNVGTNGFGNIVAGGSHCIFAKDGDAGGGLYCLTALSGSNLAISIGNVSMTTLNYTLAGYTTGTWIHIVYIMDATEQRLYINNNLAATVAGAPNFGTMNTKQLCLGRFGSNWYPVNGALDEFRVYNRVLNLAEIAVLSSGNPASLGVTNVSPLTLCAGDAISADFSASGTIQAGNVYTLQLSDAAGNFTFPLNIGTLTSNALTGTIPATVPQGVPSGTGYRVRITSSLPTSVSPAGTQTITVNGVLGDIPGAGFSYMGNSGGKDFFYNATALSWVNAQNNCVANGGNLATIPNAATNAFIAANVPVGVFIGFTDQTQEGTFTWIDGSPVTYQNWNAGEPNNSGNEDYTQLFASTGRWNDVPATATSAYVMQLAPARSNSPVCTGGAITLFAATLSGATYSWSGPNGFASTSQNPVIASATLADGGTYTVTITKNGCTGTATTTVTVNQAPNAIGGVSTLLTSLSSGLILHYTMNGNANDASGNNLNGTMFGGVTAVADRFGNAGNALQFNGSNGYIDVPDGVYFSGDFTVSCWVKAASYASWSRVFDFGNGPANNNVLLAVTNGTTGRPAAEIYNGTASGGQINSASVQLGLNQWKLLTYTFTGGAGRVYLNGTQIAGGTQTTPQNVLRTLCYIGRSNWAGDAYANASFDDFRIYNRAITTMEMASLLMEQPDAMNLVATPASVCPNTAGIIHVIGTQPGVSYQLQNAATSTNIGAAQTGNGDTLSFATGNLAANTTFQVVATAPGGCQVTISSVTVSVITLAAAPATTGASRCEPGTVTLSASGAPAGGVYNWYTVSTGGTVIFTGPAFTTPVLTTTTTYYVAILLNGCESPRAPVTATINLATAPAVDLYTGLIVHYKLDGNTADSSGRGNNANLNWNGAYVNDRFAQPNSALQPVTGAYLDAGNPGDLQALTTQVTISMWINETPGNWGFFAPLANKWQNNGLYMGLDSYYDVGAGQQMNRVRWRVNGATYVNSNTNVPHNTWHHIVCTYNGSRLRIYQNGVLTGDVAYTGVITNTITNFQVGRQANGLGNAIFEGIYDEVRVYNRALNQDEVLALYFNNSVAFSNTPLCEGNTLLLTSPSIAGATYQWNGPNGFSSTQQNPAGIPNATAANAGTYTLVITNPNGCITSPQTNTVVVNPLPSAPLTVNDTVCGSGNAILTASGGTSYRWYTVPTGGTPISGQAGATYTINNLTATDTFYVSILSAAGCESPGRTMVIAYYQNPMQTNLPVSGSTVCAGASTATVTVQTSQNGITYQAFFNSSAVSTPVTGNGGTIALTVNTATLGAGNNTITVTANQLGCGSVNLSDTATVTINALPSANVTASGPVTFCTGGDVTLTATAGTSWLWSNGATTQNITVSTSGTYSVTVTDVNGCSNTSTGTTVSVLAPPVASLSASGPLTFCQGGDVTLTASGGGTYTWSNGATASAITVSTSGTYYVIVSNGACADTSSSVTVVVDPTPNATITASGPLSFCQGDNVVLTASGGGTYLWSNGATTSSITVTASGSYDVTVTNAGGCSATSPAVNVTVNTLPAATLSASGPLTFCQGDDVTLTASGGSSYAWSNGATSSAITVTTSGTYYVIASNGACVDTSSSVTVVVDPAPSASVSASGPLTFCQGGNVVLTASGGGTYLWSTGATTSTITVTASGSYGVTVTNANGCSATSSALNVNVLSPPTATISASGPLTFCQGDDVMLTAGGGSSYAWSTGATGSSIFVSQSGTYYVVANNATCSDTSAAITVVVNPLPNVSFVLPVDTFCIMGPAYTLSGGSPAGGTYSGQGVTGNQFDPFMAGFGDIEIFYDYTDANGCSNFSSVMVYVDFCTGVENAVSTPALSAAPNPASGTTMISWTAANVSTLDVFDATGRLVLTENVSGKSSVEISLNGLAAGVYQVKLSGEEILFLRLVKQ